jgi:hypothetical protein
MARLSYEESKHRRRNERSSGERYVQLRLDFEHEDSGEIALTAGGVWDKRFQEFSGAAAERVAVRFHEGQRRAVEWFVAWIAAHHDRREHPPRLTLADLEGFELDTDPEHAYSALFAGGRRGGKTWIAVAMTVAYAIMFPGSIVWIVSPNDQKHDEIRRYLHDFIAAVWLDSQTTWDYELINGSTINLKSAHGTGGGLKEGKANLVLLNEGQMMKQRAFVVARGAIVDASGCVIVCANPPVDAGDQIWVSDFAAEAGSGRRAAVFVEFNPLLNPHIDRGALLAMKGDLDDRSFKIEVLGMFMGPADAVAYNWLRLENERPTPNAVLDVTGLLLSVMEEGDGFTAVAGVDFQRFPYIGGPIYRFFGEVHRDRVLAWIVDEVIVDGGDEVSYCDELRAKGYDPETTLIVGDASGRYQHTRRSRFDQPPPHFTGRGSFDVIRSEGYVHIVPPDRRLKANPAIVDRMRAFTSMVSSGFNVRRLFCDPVRAPRTAKAIREWRTLHGMPSRTAYEAHIGDGASYPIVRLFPRRLRSDKTGAVDPIVSLVDKLPSSGAAPRIMPPSFAPSGRRGSRTRGM